MAMYLTGERSILLGDGSYKYPENVLLAADNPVRFQEELQTAQSYQLEAMNQALKYLEDNDYLDLKKLAAAVMEDAQDSPSDQSVCPWPLII